MRRHERRRSCIDKEQPGIGVAQHRRERSRCDRRCEGCHKRPRAQASEEKRRLLRCSQSAKRNHIARTHTVALKRGCHAIHQRVELAERDPALVLYQRRLLRPRRGVLANEIGDVAERRVKHRSPISAHSVWKQSGVTATQPRTRAGPKLRVQPLP